MTRVPRSRRLILVGAIAILGLSACGTAPTSTGSPATDAPTTTVKSPAVIVLGNQSGTTGAGTPTASADQVAADPAIAEGEFDSKMAWPGNIVYEYEGTPPELPTTATAWYFPADQRATAEQVAALAAALGVEGDVVALPADQGGGFLVGPSDYTTPTVNVSSDALQSWWFGAGATSSSVAPCETIQPPDAGIDPDVAEEPVGDDVEDAGAADGAVAVMSQAAPPDDTSVDAPEPTEPRPTEPTEPGAAEQGDIEPAPDPAVDPAIVPECMEITPPTGVPTSAEAEQLAKDLFAKVGMDAASYEYEVYADEWNASVTAYLVLDGIRTSVTANVGFGADAQLTWASGFLGSPVRGDEYPLIGVQGGIDRLNEQSASWGDPAILQRDAEIDAAASDMVDEPAIAVEEPMPPADPDSDANTNDTGTNPDADTKEVPAEPETVVITFVDAHSSLEQVWAEDGTVWLLPGYRFDTVDAGWYTVTAVEDQYLQQSESVIVEPAPTDIAPTEPAVAEPSAGCPAFDMPTGNTEPGSIDPVGVQWYVGLCVADAQAAAEAVGYTFRVVREDGVDLPATADFNDWRVNVAVKDGIVTEIVSIG
jgi:hypothetical protein